MHPSKAEGEYGSRGVRHQRLYGIESATENGHAKVLGSDDDDTDSERKANTAAGRAQHGHACETDAEKENKSKRKCKVDHVSGDKSTKRPAVSLGAGHEMKGRDGAKHSPTTTGLRGRLREVI